MMDGYSMYMFAVFVSMLVGLLVLHHHKNWVVGLGFAALSIGFILHQDVGHWGEHFAEHHRFHLLYNLALLLPAFSVAAYIVEHSGASHWLARVLKSDVVLLASVFVLSIFLDNIAAALIGGTILLAKYGAGNVPFKMIVGIIGASNLGGAGSPVGDTTTVMMYISEHPKVPVTEIFKAFVPALVAHVLLTMWAVRHSATPEPSMKESGRKEHVREILDPEEAQVLEEAVVRAEHDTYEGATETLGLAEASHDRKVHWRQMWGMLAIPGLVIGNLFDQPGFGVWIGLAIGLTLAWHLPGWRPLLDALPNTAFLLLLVGSAEMLPLEVLKVAIEEYPRDYVAIGMGLLSPWFDNIPLTAICLQLDKFDWGLLAYCVGFGGSAMWFGSSAGVAVGNIFKQAHDTKRWGVPFIVITITYIAGVIGFQLVFDFLAPALVGTGG